MFLVKIQEYTNKCSVLQYQVFTTKTSGLRRVSAFPVGRPKGVKFCICVRRAL